MDGCFDLMHYGHMNAFRQGKALGTHLVVGVNSDETITGTQAGESLSETCLQSDMLRFASPFLSPSDPAPVLSSLPLSVQGPAGDGRRGALRGGGGVSVRG